MTVTGEESLEATNSRPSPRRPSTTRSWRTFWPYLRPERGRFVLLVATSFVGGLTEAITLVLITNLALSLGSAGDTVQLRAGGVNLSLDPATSFGLALVAVLVRTGLGVVNGWLSAALSTRATARLRRRLNAAYLRAEWGFQAKQPEGHLQDLVGNYAIQVATGLGTLGNLTVAAASLLMMVGSALVVSPIAAVSLGLGAAVLSITQRPLRAATRRRSAANNQAATQLNLTVTETAQIMPEIRTFGVRAAVEDRLDGLVERSRHMNQRFVVLSSLAIYAYQGAALLLVVGALGVVYLAGASNVGSLAAVVLILVRSLSYAQQVQALTQTLQGFTPAAELVDREVDALDQHAAVEGHVRADHIGDLELRSVSFAYDQDRRALDDVSAFVRSGEAIGLVGPSGAGKSTLVQILLRLRTPTSGAYLVDGVPASEIDAEDWYRRVAFVSQDNRLFDGTVRDNISFYRDASQEQIDNAARLAHIHDEIASWPDGYETRVGIRGGSISGGQRQRLCLARALLTEPDILVLDEPTSALDLHSEELVHQTLRELHGRVSILIVAHRLSTLRVCDRIMVLEDGRLEAFAPAAQLEAENPFFARAISLSQTRSLEADPEQDESPLLPLPPQIDADAAG